MTHKTAIIGLGIMGRRMLGQMQTHRSITVVSAWDLNPDSCASALNDVSDLNLVSTATEAINQADLIYLACPPAPRHAYSLEAIDAGKPVFLEKPLGVDLKASRELVTAIETAGIPSAVNFTQAAGAALADVSASARAGEMGDLMGIDIVVTLSNWPRDWQKAADWLRFKAEGGVTREVISHFLFFSERILGPLTVVWSRPVYPQDSALCETALLARLENKNGVPVHVMASVGGAQADRQELTIKGTKSSRRVADFYRDLKSDGGPFEEVTAPDNDARATGLQAQLDDLDLLLAGKPNQLATVQEALRVQTLVEEMLTGAG